ncbi:glycosyltransferase [Erwinia tracheiphila]|uniref:Glycosyltransferase family 2 protein n=1 Tax=Erwinia tracheiphila TaxID=65700 RepID=A0A0M2K854_9GAMM|nr:glycosyltransferase family 2 protein [Erwinia tracheiphila]AXF76380.1 glycosyltransferase family 2 protein [Erwinia tracheiphila]EOS96438.1 glycosyl transferase family protein [Erwinia tracheiphila PSU-1]KKF35119.1 WcaA [Erwinia tracheiphila]UIA84963.1 glycosyltransferase [Erwinia tracheiphila]UIA90141.1 glycosyltransferase [Erwinia tracheiphila]
MKTQIGTVGIVIPMYNARQTVLRAVQSVLDQSWTDWHIYLINDKSTDDSLAFVQEHCRDPRITIFNNEVNLGAAETRNVGLKAASEEIIAFLDSDDEWEKDKLMLQVQALAAGDDLVISHYRYHSRTKSYDVIWNKAYLMKDSFVKKQFRVCFSSVCYRRPSHNVFFRKKGHEDFLFLYELFEQYKQARVIECNLVKYYELGDSLSRNKNKAAKWHLDLLRFIYKNNPLKVYYYYVWYMVNGVLFTLKHR